MVDRIVDDFKRVANDRRTRTLYQSTDPNNSLKQGSKKPTSDRPRRLEYVSGQVKFKVCVVCLGYYLPEGQVQASKTGRSFLIPVKRENMSTVTCESTE